MSSKEKRQSSEEDPREAYDDNSDIRMEDGRSSPGENAESDGDNTGTATAHSAKNHDGVKEGSGVEVYDKSRWRRGTVLRIRKDGAVDLRFEDVDNGAIARKVDCKTLRLLPPLIEDDFVIVLDEDRLPRRASILKVRKDGGYDVQFLDTGEKAKDIPRARILESSSCPGLLRSFRSAFEAFSRTIEKWTTPTIVYFKGQQVEVLDKSTNAWKDAHIVKLRAGNIYDVKYREFVNRATKRDHSSEEEARDQGIEKKVPHDRIRSPLWVALVLRRFVKAMTTFECRITCPDLHCFGFREGDPIQWKDLEGGYQLGVIRKVREGGSYDITTIHQDVEKKVDSNRIRRRLALPLIPVGTTVVVIAPVADAKSFSSNEVERKGKIFNIDSSGEFYSVRMLGKTKKKKKAENGDDGGESDDDEAEEVKVHRSLLQNAAAVLAPGAHVRALFRDEHGNFIMKDAVVLWVSRRRGSACLKTNDGMMHTDYSLKDLNADSVHSKYAFCLHNTSSVGYNCPTIAQGSQLLDYLSILVLLFIALLLALIQLDHGWELFNLSSPDSLYDIYVRKKLGKVESATFENTTAKVADISATQLSTSLQMGLNRTWAALGLSGLTILVVVFVGVLAVEIGTTCRKGPSFWPLSWPDPKVVLCYLLTGMLSSIFATTISYASMALKVQRVGLDQLPDSMDMMDLAAMSFQYNPFQLRDELSSIADILYAAICKGVISYCSILFSLFALLTGSCFWERIVGTTLAVPATAYVSAQSLASFQVLMATHRWEIENGVMGLSQSMDKAVGMLVSTAWMCGATCAFAFTWRRYRQLVQHNLDRGGELTHETLQQAKQGFYGPEAQREANEEEYEAAVRRGGPISYICSRCYTWLAVNCAAALASVILNALVFESATESRYFVASADSDALRTRWRKYFSIHLWLSVCFGLIAIGCAAWYRYMRLINPGEFAEPGIDIQPVTSKTSLGQARNDEEDGSQLKKSSRSKSDQRQKRRSKTKRRNERNEDEEVSSEQKSIAQRRPADGNRERFEEEEKHGEDNEDETFTERRRSKNARSKGSLKERKLSAEENDDGDSESESANSKK